jgi:hypothetical protein
VPPPDTARACSAGAASASPSCATARRRSPRRHRPQRPSCAARRMVSESPAASRRKQRHREESGALWKKAAASRRKRRAFEKSGARFAENQRPFAESGEIPKKHRTPDSFTRRRNRSLGSPNISGEVTKEAPASHDFGGRHEMSAGRQAISGEVTKKRGKSAELRPCRNVSAKGGTSPATWRKARQSPNISGGVANGVLDVGFFPARWQDERSQSDSFRASLEISAEITTNATVRFRRPSSVQAATL